MKKVMGQLSPIKNWEKIWEVDKRDFSKDITRYPLKFANQMLEDKKLKILEVGVGRGNVLMFFKEKGHNVIGIDFETKVISKLKNKYHELDVRVENILKTDFKDDTFDIITLFGVIHYFEEEEQIEQSLKEVFRILKPSGKICFSVAKENLYHKLKNFFNLLSCRIKLKESVFEFNTFKEDEILNLTSSVGFRKILIEESYAEKPKFLERVFKKYLVIQAEKIIEEEEKK